MFSSLTTNIPACLYVCECKCTYVCFCLNMCITCLQRIPTWLSLSPSRHQVSVGVGEPPADRHVSCVWRPSSSGPTSSCSWCPEEFRMSGGPGGTAGWRGRGRKGGGEKGMKWFAVFVKYTDSGLSFSYVTLDQKYVPFAFLLM